MKKGTNLTAGKIIQLKIPKKIHQQIKFNLSPCNLACFKGKQKPSKSKCKIQTTKQHKNLPQPKIQGKNQIFIKNQQQTIRNRQSKLSCRNNFNQQVVFMQYDNLDVYVDKSSCKKSQEGRSKQSSDNKKSETSQELDKLIVSSCVRVITEETDNTTNTFHTTPTLTPRQSFYLAHEFYQHDPRAYNVRNRRSMTIEDNKNYQIEYQNVQLDGRTTIMVKNIPNKYNQQTLLQQFAINFQKKFDFFYLPIDKDNDCNVGYAFVNFINPTYIKQFYQEFHNKKWQKYKSPKICNICYARYQGTLELANHFRNSKILQHKDKKLKPLIGINETNFIKDLEEIVRMQRQKQ